MTACVGLRRASLVLKKWFASRASSTGYRHGGISISGAGHGRSHGVRGSAGRHGAPGAHAVARTGLVALVARQSPRTRARKADLGAGHFVRRVEPGNPSNGDTARLGFDHGTGAQCTDRGSYRAT